MSKNMMQISQRVENIPEALSIYMNQLVYDSKRRGADIITLSLGEAFFSIPLFDFSKLDIEKVYHYSESQGLPELREKIAAYYHQYYSVPLNKADILISAGSKPITYMCMQTILNDGDEVLVPEPAWLSYKEQIKLVGGVPRFIPYNAKVKEYINYFSSATKVLILNNPNNPAGWVYSQEELCFLCEECKKRSIYLLVDEAYSDFVVGEKFFSAARLMKEYNGVIVVNSLSKNMGISGWRIGYVIAAKFFIENILKLNQHIITCAPTILLHYVTKYFTEILQHTIPQAQDLVLRRQRIGKYMQERKLQFLKGGATFYFFVDISKYEYSSLQLSLYLLLKYNIAVVPGSAYGMSTEKFIRLSIGGESEERIHQAIDTICDVINFNLYDEDFIRRKYAEYEWKAFEACQ